MGDHTDEFTDVPAHINGLNLHSELHESNGGPPLRLERLVGPLGSGILHVIVLICLALFVHFVVVPPKADVQATVLPVNVKKIEDLPEIVRDIQAEDAEPLQNIRPITPPMDNAIGDTAEAEVLTETVTELDLISIREMSPIVSPVSLPRLYTNRELKGRLGAVRKHGGTRGTELAVTRALDWLRRNQTPEGTWPSDAPTAMAGLGLLTFLAHGESPSSREYGMCVNKALQFLLQTQREDGRFIHGDGHEYSQGIATYALAEFFALTRNPTCRVPMEKAVGVIVDGCIYKRFAPNGTMRPVAGLDTDSAATVTGGYFDYNLKNGAYPGGYAANYLGADGKDLRPVYSQSVRVDHSFMGFPLQALKAANVAGCANPKLQEVLAACINGVKFMQVQTSESARGGFAYASTSAVPHAGAARENQLGVGAFMLEILDTNDSPEALLAREALLGRGFHPGQNNRHGYYRIYYDANASFWFQGRTWERFNAGMKTWLPTQQDRSGHPARDGSWSMQVFDQADQHGLVYPTCLSALSLMVYYRYLIGSGGVKGPAPRRTRRMAPTREIEIQIDRQTSITWPNHVE